nr:hypothetical protein Iba_chr09bCG9910 [Ipomoea batatas]
MHGNLTAVVVPELSASSGLEERQRHALDASWNVFLKDKRFKCDYMPERVYDTRFLYQNREAKQGLDFCNDPPYYPSMIVMIHGISDSPCHWVVTTIRLPCC